MKRNPNFVTMALAVGVAVLISACAEDESPGATNQPTGAVMCEPACSAAGCQVCRIEDDVAQCVSACGPGLTCEAGQCIAPAMTRCEPSCGACQMCDLAGEDPVCVDVCAEGTECRNNACVAVEVTTACIPGCGICEICDASTESPTCVPKCGSEQTCTDDGACVRASIHAQFMPLNQPFASGPEVTQACLDCHPDAADAVRATPHWRWHGDTPNLQANVIAPSAVPLNEPTGKKNLINNFCVAIAGNEKRCTQCHAGYNWGNELDADGRAVFDFEEATLGPDRPSNIDCLVCHADMASGYTKAKPTAGAVPDSVDLSLVAQSVGESTNANCGFCHFGAGGGDNVKKGDLGSALRAPSVHTDVHLGRNMTCSDCHVRDGHTILGQGVHNPVSEGRLFCVDCHSETPHELSIYDEHAIDVACETCHIPAFSRSQPTKMWWDWSTAGNKSIGTNGVATSSLADGTIVQTYNWMKGDFVWEKNVQPEYAWYDGGVQHLDVWSQFPDGQGTVDNPVRIAGPTADKSVPTAKIYPFKVMRGRQPAHVAERFLISPKLFGPGGFWPQVPAADSYTPEAVKNLWTQTLQTGARLAGQIPLDGSIAAEDWGYVYTEMYMIINHEVAPKDMALGQPPCSGCHFNEGFPWTALGYACDPVRDPGPCGSRHYSGQE